MHISTRITALAVAATLIGGGAAILAPAAGSQAHAGTATSTGECSTSGSAVVTITLANDYGTPMTVTASDNATAPVGSVVAKTSSRTFKQTVAAPAAGKVVSVKLDVAWTDGFKQAGVTTAYTVDAGCTGPKAVLAPPLTVTQPTCTAPGAIVGLSTTRGQNGSYEQDGYRNFVSPAYTPGDSGTFTITVQKVGPGGQPGYPNGTTTTPASGTTYQLVVAPATGSQSADPTAPCFSRPDKPADKVTSTVQETTTCHTDKVLVTTTTTTTPAVWDETTKTYVDGTPVVTVTDTTRPKTDAEIKACAVVVPPTEEPTPPVTQTPTPQPTPSTPPVVTPVTVPSATPTNTPIAPVVVKPTAKPVASDSSLAYTGSNDAFIRIGEIVALLLIIAGVAIAVIRTRSRRSAE